MSISTNDFANELQRVADFYDEFKLSPKIATLLYDASKIAHSFGSIIDKNDELKAENAKLRELCETFSMIANDAVCDYYERDEMLAQANADARELGVEV